MKSLKEIDYSPLQTVRASWDLALKDTFKVSPAVTWCVLVVLCAVSLFLFGINGPFVILFVFAGFVSKKIWVQKNTAWQRFAEVNGWYVVPVFDSDPRFIPPGMMRYGAKLNMSVVVHAQFEGHECDVFLLDVTSGSGRRRQARYYTVARVLLPKPFPHLILDSKRTWAFANQGTAITKVGLEGNFDTYFSLYHDPGEHISALSIITPDVMRTLIDMNQAHDIEIADNYLFFVAAQDHRGPEALPDLLTAVDALADQIVHKAKTFSASKVHVANATLLVSALRHYGQSRDSVLASITYSIFFVLLLPLIFLLIVGIGGSLVNY